MTMEQEIQKQVREVNDKVSRILIMLIGNEYDKDDKGFIGQVNHLEKRVEVLEKWKDRAIWVFIGMGIPSGVGIWQLLNEIFKH